MAASLAEAVEPIPGVHVTDAPEVNSVFVSLPPTAIEPLQ